MISSEMPSRTGTWPTPSSLWPTRSRPNKTWPNTASKQVPSGQAMEKRKRPVGPVEKAIINLSKIVNFIIKPGTTCTKCNGEHHSAKVCTKCSHCDKWGTVTRVLLAVTNMFLVRRKSLRRLGTSMTTSVKSLNCARQIGALAPGTHVRRIIPHKIFIEGSNVSPSPILRSLARWLLIQRRWRSTLKQKFQTRAG